MTRGGKHRYATLCACAALLAALAAPAGAAAASSASEQYVLTLPGVDANNATGANPIVKRAQKAGPVGVVGERDGTVTALGAVGSAASSPVGMLVLVAVAGAGAFALLRRRGRGMRRTLAAVLALIAAMALGCGESDQATARVAPTFFGIAPQDATSDADLARMSAGKVGSYHLLVSWPRIESSKGTYHWASYDNLIGKLAVAGIQPIPYVYGTPDWMTKSENVPPTTSQKAMRGWRDFLTAAAERYGPGGDFWDTFALTHPGVEPRPLTTWEIWNEVNGPAFWAPKPDPGDYAKLLRLSAKTLHKVDSEAQIMIAGMFATPSSNKAITSFDYLHDLLRKKGVDDAIDLVAVHPYGPEVKDVKKQMNKTYKQMRKGGAGKAGMWVTEIGWGSNKKVHSQLTKTPKKQAKLLTKTYKMMIAKRNHWNLHGVLWYTWRDAVHPELLCGWCGSAGLVDNDLDSKPAWYAYTKLTGGKAN